jgi:hypothetical protein
MSMNSSTLPPDQPAATRRGARFSCWLFAACLLCATTNALAQDVTPAPAPPAQIDAPVAPASPSAPAPEAAPPAAPASELARLDTARALTTQLLELERRAKEIEEQRARIRTTGLQIGKIVSWVTTAVLLSSATSAWGRAEAIEKALKDGRDDEAYDSDGDGEVDKHDEKRSRRAARTLLGVSLVPIGTGLFTTLLGHKRNSEKRKLGYELEDLASKRRGLLTQLGVQLGIAPGHADLRLRLSF